MKRKGEISRLPRTRAETTLAASAATTNARWRAQILRDKVLNCTDLLLLIAHFLPVDDVLSLTLTTTIGQVKQKVALKPYFDRIKYFDPKHYDHSKASLRINAPDDKAIQDHDLIWFPKNILVLEYGVFCNAFKIPNLSCFNILIKLRLGTYFDMDLKSQHRFPESLKEIEFGDHFNNCGKDIPNLTYLTNLTTLKLGRFFDQRLLRHYLPRGLALIKLLRFHKLDKMVRDETLRDLNIREFGRESSYEIANMSYLNMARVNPGIQVKFTYSKCDHYYDPNVKF
jgi:hypothetical protein